MTPKHWGLVGLAVCGMGLIPLLTFGGCSLVAPSHALAIDLTSSNATAFNRVVQSDVNVPAYVKLWVGCDANDWATMSLWAHGKATTPTTAK